MTISLIIVLIVIGIIIIVIMNQKHNKPPISLQNIDNTINVSKFEYNKCIDIQFDFEEDKINLKGKYLFLDVETTGLPKDRYAQPEDIDNWPRVVQIAWVLFNDEQKIIDKQCYILKQKNKIPQKSIEIHKITDEIAKRDGIEPKEVYELFAKSIINSEFIIAHNIDFDIPIIQSDFILNNLDKPFQRKKMICTMMSTINFCAIPSNYGNKFKYPSLTELYKNCFYANNSSISINKTHNAEVDTMITAKCFFYLQNKGIIILDKPKKEKQNIVKLNDNINFVEKIKFTTEKLTDEQINSRFFPADKICKRATETFDYDQEQSINLIIEAINTFPYLIPQYFHKLSYYLQRANFYDQAYQVLEMVIADLDFNDIVGYNMGKSINIEKYANIKYSERKNKEYIYYFFKWYHNRLLSYTFQGRPDDLMSILNSKDKLTLWAPTKINGSFKKLKLETLIEQYNNKLIEYDNNLSDQLISTCSSIQELEKNIKFESGLSIGESMNKAIKQNKKLYEIYKSLNSSIDEDYFKTNIELLIK